MTTLERHNIETSKIKKGLSNLFLNKSQKIERVLEKLEGNNVRLDAIEKNITTVIDADVDEIDGIIGTLRSLGMSVEDNIGILANTNSEDLNNIVRTLRNNGVRDHIIAQELRGIVMDKKQGIEVDDIFDDSKVSEDSKTHFKNIKRYMRLTEMYGTYFTKDDIESICAKKHVTPEAFISEMLSSNNDFVKLYYNKIMSGGRLYIGPTKAIDNKYLEEHSEEILELSRISARRFARRTIGYELDELQSLSLELIVNQCGGLVDNLQEYNGALRGAIVSRTTKCLYGVAEPQLLSITLTHTSKSGVTFISDSEIEHDVNENPYEIDEEQESLQGTFDYEKAEFSDTEEEVMECMIRLIEEGEADDLYKKIAQNIVMEEAEVLRVIHSIGQKMIQKKLVRESERGRYSFNREESEEPTEGKKDDNDDLDM